MINHERLLFYYAFATWHKISARNCSFAFGTQIVDQTKSWLQEEHRDKFALLLLCFVSNLNVNGFESTASLDEYLVIFISNSSLAICVFFGHAAASGKLFGLGASFSITLNCVYIGN